MSNISIFNRFARRTARLVGHPASFSIAVGTILLWAFMGRAFGFSDSWQLVINTATTIITFLMVFLIQNTQNRDGEAMQLKLDELIRAVEGAHNVLLGIEESTQAELDRLKARYDEVAQAAKEDIKRGLPDTAGGSSDRDTLS